MEGHQVERFVAKFDAAGAHRRPATRSKRYQPCADEGGNAQPPHGHLALPRRLDRRGGEIRDEGATGRGSKPKAGLTGFTVSKLWGSEVGKPEHIASPLQIMIEGPLGGAAFNNEFGRPNLTGYFREYEQQVGDVTRGYHKPIMIAGGLGVIDAELTKKICSRRHAADPAGRPRHAHRHGRRCGQLHGHGHQCRRAGLRLGAARQPEIERRAQEVINHCWRRARPTPSWPSTTWAPVASPMPSPS
jgi:phosphoribosylformylglycinamidine synthase